MATEKLGKILYVSDYSELGEYVKEHFLNMKKEFFQLENIIDPKEEELKILNSFDTLIFLSFHYSEKEKPSFCVHHTGNWNDPLGGEKEKLSIAIPYLLKGSFLFLKENGDIPITLEVTHHGPTIDKKIIFLEIFKNSFSEKRVDLLIETALKLPLEKGEITFGIGGNHYCSKFNKLIQENFAFGHIIPKYRELKEQTFLQAIEKVFPKKTELVIIDKKGTTKEQREKSINLCKKYNIDYQII